MKTLPIFLSLLFFVGCSQNQSNSVSVTNPNIEFEELVDIRINNDGTIHINGSTVQESDFKSQLQNININPNTKLRVLFSEIAYVGTVNKVFRYIAELNPEASVDAQMVSAQEFENYDEKKIHIDVLSSGKVLFKGNSLYVDDLPIALASIQNKETTILLSVSDDATFGQVYDVQNAISRSEFKDIHSPIKRE